jgi:hypothetical protein
MYCLVAATALLRPNGLRISRRLEEMRSIDRESFFVASGC